MAYDEGLAARIRELVADEPVTEKAMFGGLAFLIGGHMAVAAGGQGVLMVRCDPERTAELLDEPHAQPLEMRGRALRGWLGVQHEGLDPASLERWVRIGLDHARSLPPK